ncbi:MAG: hypothetical protein ABI045_03425 [Flavobacteriales bacterium]
MLKSICHPNPLFGLRYATQLTVSIVLKEEIIYFVSSAWSYIKFSFSYILSNGLTL